MNGSEFYDKIAETTGMDAKDVKTVSEAIFDELRKQANNDERVTISNVGAFYGVNVAERVGRNPETGDKVVTPAHRALRVTFVKKYRKL
jgi:nucleoid DNA-binding protein